MKVSNFEKTNSWAIYAQKNFSCCTDKKELD